MRQHQTTQNHKKPCETSWKPTKPQLRNIIQNHTEPSKPKKHDLKTHETLQNPTKPCETRNHKTPKPQNPMFRINCKIRFEFKFYFDIEPLSR